MYCQNIRRTFRSETLYNTSKKRKIKLKYVEDKIGKNRKKKKFIYWYSVRCEKQMKPSIDSRTWFDKEKLHRTQSGTKYRCCFKSHTFTSNYLNGNISKIPFSPIVKTLSTSPTGLHSIYFYGINQDEEKWWQNYFVSLKTGKNIIGNFFLEIWEIRASGLNVKSSNHSFWFLFLHSVDIYTKLKKNVKEKP